MERSSVLSDSPIPDRTHNSAGARIHTVTKLLEICYNKELNKASRHLASYLASARRPVCNVFKYFLMAANVALDETAIQH